VTRNNKYTEDLLHLGASYVIDTSKDSLYETVIEVISGKTPDEWVRYTEFLVNEGLEDVTRGINATHILQEFILMGVLVGKGFTPEKAY